MSKITWTIKGKLKVRTKFDEIKAAFGDNNGDVPLAGVRVKVSAKESKLDFTGFESWGETFTKADGSFAITNVKDHSKRFFRVEIKFEDGSLVIFPGTLVDLPGRSDFEDGVGSFLFHADWINVWQDEEKKGPGVVDFHDLTFASISGEKLDNRDEWRHADIWFLAKKMMSELAALGDGLGFTEKTPIGIKYPHNDPLVSDDDEQAFADPIRRIVFLIDNSKLDSFDIQTVMHELMHMRNYQHCTGEEGLVVALLLYGTTHDGRQEQTWTGFHEASAEIWKSELYHQLFGQRALIYGDEKMEAERRPFTRSWLKDQGIHTLGDIDHFEFGWMSTFNLLLCRKVDELDMNASGTYAHEKTGPVHPSIARKTVQFSFADLLRAFNPLPPKFSKQIDASEMTLSKFFKRLGQVNPAFDTSMQSAYKKILDPKETGQPSELLPRLR